VRAGGKHNDLENVGFTRRHHTFFEMLGNFSFGIISNARRLGLLGAGDQPRVVRDPKERLYVTIFEGADGVAATMRPRAIGLSGVPKERIREYGLKDNFWQMADGPCGPCSEIFYDMGWRRLRLRS